MSKVYIGLEDAIEVLNKYEDYKGYLQGDYEQILREQVEPADVKPVVRGENIATEYAECDQFICSKCGIHLQDWKRLERLHRLGRISDRGHALEV